MAAGAISKTLRDIDRKYPVPLDRRELRIFVERSVDQIVGEIRTKLGDPPGTAWWCYACVALAAYRRQISIGELDGFLEWVERCRPLPDGHPQRIRHAGKTFTAVWKKKLTQQQIYWGPSPDWED